MPNKVTELPEGWADVPVLTVGSVRLGRQKSPDKHTGRYSTKYLRAANVTGKGLDLSDVLEMDFTPAERQTYALRQGDIVLAEASGSSSQVGRPALWRGEIPVCCFQNTLIRFRPRAVLPEYAIVVFRHYVANGDFAKLSRGVGIQHLGATRFAQMVFPLPPMAEQRKIAAEVDLRMARLDEAEASLESALRHIQEQNREILAASANGSILGRGRTGEDGSRVDRSPAMAEGLPAGGGRGEGGDRGGSLPDGWVWTTVGAVGDLKVGRQLSSSRVHGGVPTPYLRTANITPDGLNLADIRKMDLEPGEACACALEPGDVLIVESSGSPSQVGRPAVWRGEIEGCCFQNHIIRFRSSRVLSEYALLVFRYYSESGAFGRTAHGMGIQHLGLSRLSQMPFPLPPLPLQERIVDEAYRRLGESKMQEAAVTESLSRIGDMRVELLHAAVSGLLVPQSDGDEPAYRMLERLGQPTSEEPDSPPDAPEEEVQVSDHPVNRTADAKSRLGEVLRKAQAPLRVTELFSLAGYDPDSMEEVELFYLALRSAIGQNVRQVGGAGEDALLEAL